MRKGRTNTAKTADRRKKGKKKNVRKRIGHLEGGPRDDSGPMLRPGVAWILGVAKC